MILTRIQVLLHSYALHENIYAYKVFICLKADMGDSEDAVQWRLMKLNIAEARARNARLRPEEIETAVDQALDEVRADRLSRRP